MKTDFITNISPIDGRYGEKTQVLSDYFSEYALIKYRVEVEIEYLIALLELNLPQAPVLKVNQKSKLIDIYKKFTVSHAQEVKKIEAITNHDVKAVEYYIKDKLDKLGMSEVKEFVHFGLTSQDINNTAVPLSLKRMVEEQYSPLIQKLINQINACSSQWKNVSMLARTHGQPASPTILGKEMQVFSERLTIQFNVLRSIPFSSKFGGATGNFNAHFIAFPEVDWVSFSDKFVNSNLGLNRSKTTTQIEHYDNMAALFDAMGRINNILIDFSRDIWTYISMNYFNQKIIKGEVGSSAMPHKVNPIDFENAEGNLGLANATFTHLSSKLPISRLQRDLTDSTVLRNIGVPIAHSFISFKALLKGINKLILNKETIDKDLNNNWEVVAEAIQTVLRREGYPNPYETLKQLTRNNESLGEETLHIFINKLDISKELKEELKKITPFNYTGINLVKSTR